jgi:hypothetical protein
MARAKRGSAVLDAARQRLAGLKSITPPPNFGGSLQVTDYEQGINDLSEKIDRYNGMLATLDSLQNEIEADERDLRTTNARMLSAAEAQYGPDSSEYEQAGGTRRSERKRASKKPPTP